MYIEEVGVSNRKVLNNYASGTVTWADAKAAIRHFHDKKDYISLYHKAIKTLHLVSFQKNGK